MLADFTQVTRDAGEVIRRVNDRFGTDFRRFIHTREAEQTIFKRYDYYLSPDPERDSIKAAIEWEYETRSNGAWISRAEAIYRRLTDTGSDAGFAAARHARLRAALDRSIGSSAAP